MDLPELHSDELSLLEFLDQNCCSVDGAVPNANALSQVGNIIGQDEILAKPWLNTSFIALNQNMVSGANEQSEIFSDTESLTSCGSAVASPAVFDQTERSHFTFIEDQELKVLSVKELNLKLKGQPKDVVQAAKKRRRTLKNRGYAHSCRIKRIKEKDTLQRSKQELQDIIASQKQELEATKNERDLYKSQCEKLVTFLKQSYSYNTSS